MNTLETTYYDSLTLDQRQHYDNQERFLRAYEVHGRLYLAGGSADIGINTWQGWQTHDTHSFQKRLLDAQKRYTESVEAIMDERLANPQGNRGSDPLLMFKLKALDPGKYREDIKVIDGGVAVQLLDALRALGSVAPVKVLEAGSVVEAEVRDEVG